MFFPLKTRTLNLGEIKKNGLQSRKKNHFVSLDSYFFRRLAPRFATYKSTRHIHFSNVMAGLQTKYHKDGNWIPENYTQDYSSASSDKKGTNKLPMAKTASRHFLARVEPPPTPLGCQPWSTEGCVIRSIKTTKSQIKTNETKEKKQTIQLKVVWVITIPMERDTNFG